ncbi:MAG TPA: universal stress protein [Mycobacterium sp.]|nr:universal stress protein [Mycobacterium sp.]
MHDSHPVPAVVVGIDGSQAALSAAVWAAGEAADRGIPLKLVYVIYDADLPGAEIGCDTDRGGDQLAAAHAALADARRAVQATETPANVETEVRWGNPLATLIELSRSAAMVCVGAIGIEHACHRAGSTAAALAGSAGCPVAVIRGSDLGRRAETGHIVVEVDASPDNNVVLRWALAEAKLRRAPLRVITADQTAQPSRLIDRWAPRYPDVLVESVAVSGGVTEYLAACLAEEGESIRLFVSGTRDRRSLGWPGDAGGCSVLTVAGTWW